MEATPIKVRPVAVDRCTFSRLVITVDDIMVGVVTDAAVDKSNACVTDDGPKRSGIAALRRAE